MSQILGETPSKTQATISRPLRELIQQAEAPLKEPDPPSSDMHYWIQEAELSVERAKALHTEGRIDDAFTDFAKAAVILRAKLPGLPGYAQLSIDQKHSIALTVYETFSYIDRFHTNILGQTPSFNTFPNSNFGESQRATRDQKESLEDSDAWNSLKSIIGYEEGAGAENLVVFDQTHGHSDGHQPITSTRMPSLPPAYATVAPLDRRFENVDSNAATLEEPRSPLVGPRSIKEVYKPPISMLIPEIPPEPISLFLDLYPLEESHLIPDFSPSKLEFTLDEERADPQITKKSSLSKILRKIIDKFP